MKSAGFRKTIARNGKSYVYWSFFGKAILDDRPEIDIFWLIEGFTNGLRLGLERRPPCLNSKTVRDNPNVVQLWLTKK